MTSGERRNKTFTQNLGILIQKHTSGSSEKLRCTARYDQHRINFDFDIGANKGQYVRSMMDSGHQVRISSEPSSNVHDSLTSIAKRIDQWNIASSRTTVRSISGEVLLHYSAISVSNTFGNLLPTHKKWAADTAIIAEEKVDVKILYTHATDYAHPEDKLILKRAVEGFDEEASKGGQTAASRDIGVEMEISIVPLYESQEFLLAKVLSYLQEKEFTLVGIDTRFTKFETVEVFQNNDVFFPRKKDQPLSI